MLSRVIALLGATAALVGPAFADATFFRSDFGVASSAKGLPGELDSPNALVWRVDVDAGHSTPILVKKRLFFTTSHRGELATVCLDAESGRALWRRPLTVVKIEEFHPQEGNAAMATPASDGDHLFVFFGSYGLICYDLNGKQLWEKHMGPFRDEYGAASSPILAGDKLILNEDHDVDSFLLALSPQTGAEIWRTPRPAAVRSYSTPALWNRKGGEELLVAGALEVAGYDLSTGKKLWWVDGLARIVIPTPLPSGDTVYMASWAPGGDPGQRLALGTFEHALQRWDKNHDGKLAKDEITDGEVISRFFRMDLDQNQLLDADEWARHAEVFTRAQNAILALKPHGRGDLTDSAILWKYQRGAPYVASPAAHDGIVWMVKDGGLVTKLDAASGQLLQQERLGATGNYYSSPVIADGKVYFASVNGVVTIVAEEKDWKILSSNPFKEKIFATPLASGNTLYLRTEKAIYCFRAPNNPH